MKKIITLALLMFSFSTMGQMDYTVCGDYKMLNSCGMFAAHTPVLITEQGTFSLDSSCPAQRMELCNLRYSLVMLMTSGQKYCVGGVLNRAYQSPCADDSILVNNVFKDER